MFILLIIYALFCALVGAMGQNRKIGFAGGFFVSLIFSPLIGILVVLTSSHKKVWVKDSIDISEELLMLHKLKEKGIIGEEEYEERASILKEKL